MPVVAVINRKGGSGKSTLATHLAGYCATKGIPVMLGDVDRQQSTQTWLRLREARQPAQRAPILGWTVDPKNGLRVPPGIAHVILDTPGGLHGFDLARVVMLADLIIMPLCNSVFDRDSAAECHAELMKHPRIVSGRCKVAAVGMRLDARTKAGEVLKEWAGQRHLPFIGVLRETQAYVKCIEQGLTLFDMTGASVEADMAQWQPILDWVGPVLHAAPQRSDHLQDGVKATARRAIERAVSSSREECAAVAAAQAATQAAAESASQAAVPAVEAAAAAPAAGDPAQSTVRASRVVRVPPGVQMQAVVAARAAQPRAQQRPPQSAAPAARAVASAAAPAVRPAPRAAAEPSWFAVWCARAMKLFAGLPTPRHR